MAYNNPPAFPTLPGANKPDVKVNVSPTQEVISLDLNNISNYLHQIIKDFNLNVFANSYGTATGNTQGGCIVNGMNVTGTVASSVNISSGLLIFSAYPDTGSTAFSGTLVQFPGIGLSIDFPGSNSWIVGIDIPYTEIPDSTLTYRNFYNVTGDTVQSQATSVSTVPTIGTILTPNGAASVSPVPPPVSAGCIRVANITVNSTANITNISYTLPFIWNAQGWPGGTPGNVANLLTLNDSLSAIRFQLNQIISSTTPSDASGNPTAQNWSNTVPLALNQLITWGGVDSGTPNHYKLTIPYFSASIVAGMKVCFHAVSANTGASTLQINGGTLYPIVDSVGNSLAPSAINGSQFLFLVFDGTNWVIPNILSVTPVTQLQVPNGSFENWAGSTLSTWSIPSISSGVVVSRDTSGSIDGGSALEVFSGNVGGVGGNATFVSGLITISPQDTYFIKWKTKCALATYTTAVEVTFYDATKTPIVSSTQPLFTNGPSTHKLNVNWQTYYGVVMDSTFNSSNVQSGVAGGIAIMPANARFMAVVIATGTSSPGLSAEQNITIEFDGFEFFYPGKSGIKFSFTNSGTYNFTTPGNCTALDVTLIGGGGNGGNGTTGSTSVSGGGGGGGGIIRAIVPVVPDNIYQVVVGSGGGISKFLGLDGSTLMSATPGANGGTPGGGGGGTWTYSFTNTPGVIVGLNGVTGQNGASSGPGVWYTGGFGGRSFSNTGVYVDGEGGTNGVPPGSSNINPGPGPSPGTGSSPGGGGQGGNAGFYGFDGGFGASGAAYIEI